MKVLRCEIYSKTITKCEVLYTHIYIHMHVCIFRRIYRNKACLSAVYVQVDIL